MSESMKNVSIHLFLTLYELQKQSYHHLVYSAWMLNARVKNKRLILGFQTLCDEKCKSNYTHYTDYEVNIYLTLCFFDKGF